MEDVPEPGDEVHLEIGRWMADWSALVGTLRIEIMRCIAHEPSVSGDPDMYVRRSRALKELIACIDDGRLAAVLQSAVLAMNALSHEQATALDDLVSRFQKSNSYRNRMAHDMIGVLAHDGTHSVLRLPFQRDKRKAASRRDPETAAKRGVDDGDSLPFLGVAGIREQRVAVRTLIRDVQAFLDTLT